MMGSSLLMEPPSSEFSTWVTGSVANNSIQLSAYYLKAFLGLKKVVAWVIRHSRAMAFTSVR